jgi:transposase
VIKARKISNQNVYGVKEVIFKRLQHSYVRIRKDVRKMNFILNRIKHEGVCAVSISTGIPKTTLYSWQKRGFTVGRLRRPGGGRKPFLNELIEQQILDWVLQRRQHKLLVTRQSIKEKAGMLGNFSPSDKWLQGFINRHGLSLRIPTLASTTLFTREQLQQHLLNFWNEALMHRQNFNISMNNIGNMDECALYMETLPKYTIDQKGAKSVVVKTTGKFVSSR